MNPAHTTLESSQRTAAYSNADPTRPDSSDFQ